MKARIIRIGNSRGIRLPKPLLAEAQLAEEVELRAEPGRIVIRSARRPRAGWAEEARRMHELGEDQLLDEATPTRFDQEEWEWQ
ncbi:MAG: AbrB/MazE/SpoVT family DNA-binding domain-containing protein [Chloroflexi bacterium]|nr:AbrB/MazE/SpoVT family DNA-binding domain-containing protein [Chloroflexota bacterium]